MTEKRFTIEYDGDMDNIIDNNSGKVVYPFDYVQPLCDLLNDIVEENQKLKETLNLIAEADSYTKENSVKEILRREIKAIDTVAGESADAWNDYCLLSNFFEEQYNELWDNYED